MILGTNFNLHMDTQLQFQNQDRSIMNKGCPDSYFSAKQICNEKNFSYRIYWQKQRQWTAGYILMFILVMLSFNVKSQVNVDFSYTGGVQYWTVPSGVTSITINVWGAQGGTYYNLGGLGGYAQGTLAVTPGQVLYVYVGQQPTTFSGGYNGGGAGYSDTYSRGGGGASDVRTSPYGLNNRVIVGGGGGGATNQATEIGGYGGGLTGGDGRGAEGYIGDNFCGHGGTQSAGGNGSNYYAKSTPGSFGQGGNSLLAANPVGGGGGGGWYGGGGGDHGGGGGGSSYIGGVLNGTTTANQQSGNGFVRITYSVNPPVVSTTSISNVNSNSATCGGNVTSDGGSAVTARGVCWSTSQNPTISNSTTNDGTGTGSFTSSITGLTAGTTYYVRAYATNVQGTSYGTQQSVTPFQLGTFANITKTYGDAPFTLVDPTSASTGAFTYTSDNTGVATISGNTVTITGAGTTTITATQAASGIYSSANTTATLTVSKSDQTISFAAPASKMLGEADFDLAGSSSSALELSYVSSDPNVATVSGKTVTIIGVGTTQITASQSGNANYYAASSVTQDFTVLSNEVSWTGAVSTDWNEAGNWSNNQVPTNISNITISSSPVNQPSVTSLPGNPAICNDLTVASGASVSIEPGKALTVNGTITLLGTQGLIVKSDSTGSGSLLDNGYSGAGTAKIEQYLPANTFHQLGIPISNTIQGGWGTGQTGNVFLYCSLDSYDETNDNYVGITGNDNVVPDRGFVTSYLNASNQPKMLRFTGNPNTGSKSFAMTKYGLGYNLIPNPYPSAIDWDASSGWDKSVASDNSIFIWNHSNMQFATYNGFIGVNGGSRYIAPCQSFFVSSQGNGNIVMNNSVRVHESTTYLKSGTIPDNLIRLKVSGTTNSFNDETVVYFTTNPGSEGSEKWMTSEATAPSLYSEKYSKNYAINILPKTSQNQTVPVKFTAGVDGNYSIKATEIGVFDNVSTIILEDLKTGTTQNLQSHPIYNFTSSKTDDASRFLLHFNTSTSIEENQSLKPYIYESDNTVYIRGKVDQVMVYNILGQVVKSVNSTEDYSSIDLNGQAPGSYVVKVVVNNQVYTEKVVIK